METSSLEKLIAALERGTKMHISILPLGRTGFCGKLALPQNHIIHAHPYCDRMKTTRAGLKKCLICKHFATRRAVEEKSAVLLLLHSRRMGGGRAGHTR